MEVLNTPNEIKFHSGKVPALGLGTYELLNTECIDAVVHALDCGYRHIDTARFYENEIAVGNGLKSSNIPREKIFLTTKIWHTDLDKKSMTLAIEDSLKKLQVDYVDLLLIHWPSTNDDVTYKAVEFLEELRHKEYCKFIGASNFNITLLKKSLTLAPLVCNQIEYHPYLSQQKMLEFLHENQLFLTAYCPLAQGAILQDPLIKEIARSHDRSANQIVLRWFIQQDGVSVIPKASKASHRISNFDIWDFALHTDEMYAIFELDKQKRLIDPTWSVDWST
ncbi:MAG TPA: aldo/keto reductase [Saprospiraceae bacterium]|nr:aldo/keto reductase [Saprospiraceae bacterium]